jgi:hypothetical protein
VGILGVGSGFGLCFIRNVCGVQEVAGSVVHKEPTIPQCLLRLNILLLQCREASCVPREMYFLACEPIGSLFQYTVDRRLSELISGKGGSDDWVKFLSTKKHYFNTIVIMKIKPLKQVR